MGDRGDGRNDVKMDRKDKFVNELGVFCLKKHKRKESAREKGN